MNELHISTGQGIASGDSEPITALCKSTHTQLCLKPTKGSSSQPDATNYAQLPKRGDLWIER